MDVHERIARVRAALREGDALGAGRLMEEARSSARDDADRLVVEVHSAAFQLATDVSGYGPVSTEQAWAALRGDVGVALPPLLHRRLALELRISDGIGALDIAALDDAVRDALELVQHDPAALPTAVRAVSNRLTVRMDVLERSGIGPGEPGHADALLAIGDARTLADTLGARGTIDRRAVFAAVAMGDWPRAWEWAQHALQRDALAPTERAGLVSEAAMLALERGMHAEARALGSLVHASVAGRSSVWARLWAASGFVIAAAAGGGSVTAGLRAVARSVDRDKHRAAPRYAMRAALVALEAGAPATEVLAFLEQCLGARAGWPEPWASLIEGTASPLPLQRLHELDAWCDGPGIAWQRAAALRLRAQALLREGSVTAASADISRGLRLLSAWEGHRRDELEQLRARLLPERSITPAQAGVLRLVVEGLTDREIAVELGRSPRTVESHVRALLRAYGARNRVSLAVAAAREPFLEA
ncbi:helix-turn-helix transcriptional regulator [Agrococcus sp. DT81.2]|uniref:helix-turn-helix transcriptional regulator n=1 Tax=Agrococcus sp. DT81.2 TaxID=3393414 RepID=UPI003CE539CB